MYIFTVVVVHLKSSFDVAAIDSLIETLYTFSRDFSYCLPVWQIVDAILCHSYSFLQINVRPRTKTLTFHSVYKQYYSKYFVSIRLKYFIHFIAKVYNYLQRTETSKWTKLEKIMICGNVNLNEIGFLNIVVFIWWALQFLYFQLFFLR